MRRSFISGNRVGFAQFADFFFEQADALCKASNLLLLPENLCTELIYRVVLHCDQAFKLNDTLFHGGRIADPMRKGSGFDGFYVDAMEGLE